MVSLNLCPDIGTSAFSLDTVEVSGGVDVSLFSSGPGGLASASNADASPGLVSGVTDGTD
jgi:hypothetical protein